MSVTTVPTRQRPGVFTTGGLVVTGIVLAAFNLRTAVTSVGTLLEELQRGLGMSAAIAGVLTTLPVVAFAILGGATPALARRFGQREVLLTALGLMIVGLLLRVLVESVPVFLLASALALAGGAAGNVMIPALVKLHFPHRVGSLTTTYSTALAVGTTMAAALTVPAQNLFGGQWQPALGMWAIPALIAAIPWLLLPRTSPPVQRPDATPSRSGGLLRSKLAWSMMLAFGSQSMVAYIMFGWLADLLRHSGYSASEAGFMLAVFTGIGIPVAALVPIVAARRASQRGVLLVLVAGYVLGMPLLWQGGHSWVSWAGVVLVGIGMGTFPLMLTLFALRTSTHSGTARLSAFAQSGGYLISGAGPLLVGILLGVTGSWTTPFVLLFIAVAVHVVTAWHVTRPRLLEDELVR